MKRDLNQVVKTRDGKAVKDGERANVYADYIVNALDMFNGKAPEGVTKRAIGALAGRVFDAKKPAKQVELSTEDVNLVIVALEASPYPAFVVQQIAECIEAK